MRVLLILEALPKLVIVMLSRPGSLERFTVLLPRQLARVYGGGIPL